MGGMPRTDEVWKVRADASFEFNRLGKIGACSWQVSSPSRSYCLKTRVIRRFKGASQMAETLGVIVGLLEARERGAEHVLIETDCQTVVHYLARTWESEAARHTYETHQELLKAANGFKSVQVAWVRTKPKLHDLDMASRAACHEKRKELDERWRAFVAKIGERRGEYVFRSMRTGQRTYDRYPSTIDPPHCFCPYWQRRIEVGLRLNPRNAHDACKHVAAASLDAGLTAEEAADRILSYFLDDYKSRLSLPEIMAV